MATYEGSSIQDAIEKGLNKLGLTNDQVVVQVITEGKKGFFGLGRKPAIVALNPIQAEAIKSDENKITPNAKQDTEVVEATTNQVDEELLSANLNQYITDMTANLGIPTTILTKKEKNVWTLQLACEKEGLLIGKHGKTLNALQYLAQTYVNHQLHRKLGIVLNVGDYRERRAAILQRLAENTAREVVASGQTVRLEHLPSMERKQIHQALANNQHVTTYSEGEASHRYLVVAPAKNVL